MCYEAILDLTTCLQRRRSDSSLADAAFRQGISSALGGQAQKPGKRSPRRL